MFVQQLNTDEVCEGMGKCLSRAQLSLVCRDIVRQVVTSTEVSTVHQFRVTFTPCRGAEVELTRWCWMAGVASVPGLWWYCCKHSAGSWLKEEVKTVSTHTQSPPHTHTHTVHTPENKHTSLTYLFRYIVAIWQLWSVLLNVVYCSSGRLEQRPGEKGRYAGAVYASLLTPSIINASHLPIGPRLLHSSIFLSVTLISTFTCMVHVLLISPQVQVLDPWFLTCAHMVWCSGGPSLEIPPKWIPSQPAAPKCLCTDLWCVLCTQAQVMCPRNVDPTISHLKGYRVQTHVKCRQINTHIYIHIFTHTQQCMHTSPSGFPPWGPVDWQCPLLQRIMWKTVG